MQDIQTYRVFKCNSIGERSSTGWLMKWHQGDTWLKSPGIMFDYMQDSFAEIIATEIAKDLGIDGILNYEPCILEISEHPNDSNIHRVFGCKSKDYSIQGYREITIKKLIDLDILSRKHYFSEQGYKELIREINDKFKINIQHYLEDTLLLDSIILNIDRNLWNLSIMVDNKMNGHICKIYDFGCSFGLNTYKSGEFWDEAKYANGYQAAPFESSFEEQIKYIRNNRQYEGELYNTKEMLRILYTNFTNTHNKYNILNPLTESQLNYIKDLIKQRYSAIILNKAWRTEN